MTEETLVEIMGNLKNRKHLKKQEPVSGGMYIVEKIVDKKIKKIDKKTNVLLYRVKWLGYNKK